MGVGVRWVGDHFAGVQVKSNSVGSLCSGERMVRRQGNIWLGRCVASSGVCCEGGGRCLVYVMYVPCIVSTMGRKQDGEQRDQDLPIMSRDPDPLVQMMKKQSFARFQLRVKDSTRHKAAMLDAFGISICPVLPVP